MYNYRRNFYIRGFIATILVTIGYIISWLSIILDEITILGIGAIIFILAVFGYGLIFDRLDFSSVNKKIALFRRSLEALSIFTFFFLFYFIMHFLKPDYNYHTSSFYLDVRGLWWLDFFICLGIDFSSLYFGIKLMEKLQKKKGNMKNSLKSI